MIHFPWYVVHARVFQLMAGRVQWCVCEMMNNSSVFLGWGIEWLAVMEGFESGRRGRRDQASLKVHLMVLDYANGNETPTIGHMHAKDAARGLKPSKLNYDLFSCMTLA